jgi:hydrogenase nickel incorporation protein HypB
MPNTLTRQQRFEQNSQIARAIRCDLDAAGVKALSLVGPAGSGKTSVIEALVARLNPKVRATVIVGNLAAARQVERFARHGHRAVPLITDNLTAALVREALGQVDLDKLDLLIIEADGNAISPVEFDLGQHLRATVFSVAGGDDKATEFPFLVAGSDLVLLAKVDLLPFVTFDLQVFSQDIGRLKPNLPLLQLSVQSGKGMDELRQWVESRLPTRIARTSALH